MSLAELSLLEDGLYQLGITASPLQREQLLAFVVMLHKWNRAMNLTAIRDPRQMISRHLLDSLSILPYLCGDKVIDVGTGAGLPGIPLSILCPDMSFTLLDSNQKKQIFVSQAVKSLSLKNVQCVYSTVQTYQPVQKFSTILTRAFTQLSRMISLTIHLLDDNGRFLAMMGKVEQEPLTLHEVHIEQIVSLKVPGETAQRHLAIIARQKGSIP